MGKGFKFSTMKQDRSMSLTMTIFLMISTQRMGANVQLPYSCTCKYCISLRILLCSLAYLSSVDFFSLCHVQSSPWLSHWFLLFYRSDVEEGGETVFPSAKGNFSAIPWWNELSECGKGGLSVKPKMGDALLFWSMKPDASLDPSSLHGQ